MRRLLLALATSGILAASGVAVAVHADNPIAPVDGGTAVGACYSGAAAAPDEHAAIPCHFAQNVTNQTAADCRVADNTNDDCALADGREISAAQLAAYKSSWVHRALTLQRGLDAGAPLIEEQIPHTHNTFNSSAYSAADADGDKVPSYYPTLTNQDPNQVYSISGQLDMDVRAIELDLHWVPSPYGNPSTHGFWVTMCHGDGQPVPNTGAYAHVGCSDDRPAQDGFAEVRNWLNAHPDQFVLIYLENQLYPAGPVATTDQAHQIASQLLDQAFGNLIYRPTGASPGQCATLPYGTSRTQMMASGARVLLVGNCGPGAWSSLVFTRGNTWDEHGDPSNYTAADCTADQNARRADTAFRRIFEDSTFVTAATSTPQSLTPDTVAEMVRCGVNIIGMDQLMPQDGRLAALVWSWAPNEPATAGCAYQGADGRFRSSSCDSPRSYACLDPAGGWHQTVAVGRWQAGSDACATEFPGSRFAVPVNGFRNAQLAAASTGNVWLNYAGQSGTWAPNVAPAAGVQPQTHGHAYGHNKHHGRGHATGHDRATP
jgi:hypothetical protein